MKRIYCFDLDNTLFSREHHIFHKQTIKLVKELGSNKDYILVLATGRRPAEKEYFKDIIEYFDYFVFLNGATVYKGDEIIYKKEVFKEYLKPIIEKANKNHIPLGITSTTMEYVTNMNEKVKERWALPLGYMEIDMDFDYSNIDIFQLWILEENREKVDKFISEFPHFRTFYWTEGGAHFTSESTSKGAALSFIKSIYREYQVITMGDGHNDIEMIEMSDIGIAMGNSRSDELIKKADFITNHIDDDKIYDFFKSNNLL